MLQINKLNSCLIGFMYLLRASILITIFVFCNSNIYSKTLRVFDDIEIKSFYSNYNYFIPLLEGVKVSKGFNFFLYENGSIKNLENLNLNYTLRQEIRSDLLKNSIYKAYLEYNNDIFYLSFGKKTKRIGISENSLILSKNSEPFLMLNIETKKPLNLWGLWKFEFLNGWLMEKRNDRNNPQIFILRIEYSPSSVISLGINRFSQFGGEGRPSIKIWEYPKLLIGSEDNISYSKYDADGYFGYDIVLNLSKYFKNFDLFKVYYQNIGSDIIAFWQKEDKGKFFFPFIIKLQLNSYQGGFEIKKSSNIFNLEFTSVNDLFYIHHLYNVEGYSYKNFSLGEPYGNNLNDIYFSHKKIKSNEEYFKYKIGFLKQPSSTNHRNIYKTRMKKYYLECEFSKNIKEFLLIPYLRFEYNKNFDFDPNPVKYDIRDLNKSIFIFGLNTKLRF